MTANEIWTLATEKGYGKQLNSVGKTPWATLGAQLYVNAKDSPTSLFGQTDSRPKRFYLKSQASQLDLSDTAILKEPTAPKKKRIDFLERDLHPYLTYYAWANESYLVAAEVSDEEEFRSELARLSTSFGIGVIKLDLNNPHSSEIIFPAKYREALDWETINKLTMNNDFKEFISTVKIDITSRKIHKKEYDQVQNIETLKRKMSNQSE